MIVHTDEQQARSVVSTVHTNSRGGHVRPPSRWSNHESQAEGFPSKHWSRSLSLYVTGMATRHGLAEELRPLSGVHLHRCERKVLANSVTQVTGQTLVLGYPKPAGMRLNEVRNHQRYFMVVVLSSPLPGTVIMWLFPQWASAGLGAPYIGSFFLITLGRIHPSAP